MGEAKDTAAQVEAVRKRFPDSSYLAMVGISAGSGLLVTYLGKVNLVMGFLELRSATVCFRKGTTPLLWRLPPYALPTILLVLSGFHSHLDLSNSVQYFHHRNASIMDS